MNASPGRVAILGLGPSITEYVNLSLVSGGREAMFDQVWAINQAGSVFDCDLIFHMDDMAIQEKRAELTPTGSVAKMVSWLKKSSKPVITSRAYPRYPQMKAFPLEEVIGTFKTWYFNSTAAYAVAYAVHLGATEIACFGLDFTYPNSEHAEKGRGCVEFYLGHALARGIKVSLPDRTSLMDCMVGGLYGYDTQKVEMDPVTGKLLFQAIDPADYPTADEMERRYDHLRHPNPLMEREGQ